MAHPRGTPSFCRNTPAKKNAPNHPHCANATEFFITKPKDHGRRLACRAHTEKRQVALAPASFRTWKRSATCLCPVSRKPERLLLQVRLYNLKPLLYAKELHTREAASDFLQKITRLLIHLSAMRQPARRFAPMAEDISINLMNLALNIFNREAHGDAHRP